jgi:hypothetical protein
MKILKLFFLFTTTLFSNAHYDYNIFMSNVWLSGSTYCGKENYKTMKIGGFASDFEVKSILYDRLTDLQGFIGILPSQETINVLIRGTSSIKNWIDDFEFRRVSYDTFPECNCSVHYGFYNSALRVSNQTINIIRNLVEQYPAYKIIFSGHSYGAAVNQLLSMEIVKYGYNVSIYNFGQPRVGDIKYSQFVNEKIKELYRVVHNADIVPHIPPNKILGYYHSCQEIFEDKEGNVFECNKYDCEDKVCSNQYKLQETNIEDHYVYLGHKLSCNTSVLYNL